MVIASWNFITSFSCNLIRNVHGNISAFAEAQRGHRYGSRAHFQHLARRSTNYDIDTFKTIIDAIGKLANYSYEGGMKEKAVASRVIADHLALALS